MVPEEFVVWEWVDKHGDPIYVGYGKMPMGHKTHPAKKRFQMRNQEDSDLNVYLQALKKEPRRSKELPSTKMHRREARAVVQARRSQLRKKGYELLSTRPYGTISGGGIARPIIGPGRKVYASVRKAAEAEGVNQCTITRRCARENSGWKYADA